MIVRLERILILGCVMLCAHTWAAKPVCSVSLGQLGTDLHEEFKRVNSIPEDAYKGLKGADRIKIGKPENRVVRVIHQADSAGNGYYLRHVWADNAVLFYRQRAPMQPGDDPKLVHIFVLPKIGHWEERRISRPVVIQYNDQQRVVYAFATADRIYLIDALSGKTLQKFTTGGEPIHAINLTANYLLVGVQNKLLVFFPKQLELTKDKLQAHQMTLDIEGFPDAILQSHYESKLGEARNPSTLVVSDHRLLIFGHTSDFREVDRFPDVEVSGLITDAKIENFAQEGSSMPLRVAVLRVQKDREASKLVTLNTMVRRSDPDVPPQRLSVKTVPSQLVLPHMIHHVIDVDGKQKSLVSFSDAGYKKGVVLGLSGIGRIEHEPLDPTQVELGHTLLPYNIPRYDRD
jgi:hypothetical protein